MVLRYNFLSSTRQCRNKREMIIGFQTYSVENRGDSQGARGRTWQGIRENVSDTRIRPRALGRKEGLDALSCCHLRSRSW